MLLRKTIKLITASIMIIASISTTGCSNSTGDPELFEVSGIYPHLAYFNDEGECGTGAVVPWADRLWVITYSPHKPFGSVDKLYEISPQYHRTVRPESIGGTPANRMIHSESSQLFIGSYAIDEKGNVRTISFTQMPGRLTGNARHLTDPAGKIYIGTMEEGFYEVNTKTLDVNTLYTDGNVTRKPDEMEQSAELLPGAHGKGLYSGQGVMVYTNNGEASHEALERFNIQSGVLAEWDGNRWKIIRRNQFCEVTGPGGILGNSSESDPIWVNGWDHKSLIIGVRKNEEWSFFRLPKASHSYDGAHGWNTEWPRIRNIGREEQPDFLMTMHGMFWRFPGSFSPENTAGLRPRSSYLKIIGDFTNWNNQLVFGCDDAAHNEFLNKRTVKGNIIGTGRSNSNLWFTSIYTPDSLGPTNSEGSVWLSDQVRKNEYSDPFLFAGWDIRVAWIRNEGSSNVSFSFETDEEGNGNWKSFRKVETKAGESVNVEFSDQEKGEWVRVKTDNPTKATVLFTYAQRENRLNTTDPKFTGLSDVSRGNSAGGLLWGLGGNKILLGVLAGKVTDDSFFEQGYYELDSLMNLVRRDDMKTAEHIRNKIAVPVHPVIIDEASVLIIDDKGRRWRLPKGNQKYEQLTEKGLVRVCREVVTERDLFNCSGTFYELPSENADGFAKIRPVASHHFRIHDYASYRGMLVMTGIDPAETSQNPHIINSKDGVASVWVGTIDDLWKTGKPAGEGGPWKNTVVKAGLPSDPYLIGFYDKRTLIISHDSRETVKFKMEADPTGEGTWMKFKDLTVKTGESYTYQFPDSFQSRWIRITADKECKATSLFRYE